MIGRCSAPGFALVVPCGVVVACFPKETFSQSMHRDNLSLELSLSPQVVSGFPALGLLVVHRSSDAEQAAPRLLDLPPDERREVVDRLSISSGPFPVFDFLEARPPIAFAVEDRHGAEIVAAAPPDKTAFLDPNYHPHLGSAFMYRTRVGLAPGDSMAFTVDAGRALAAISPGAYSVTVFVYSSSDSTPWRSNETTVEILDQNPEDRPTVDHIAERISNDLDLPLNLAWAKALSKNESLGVLRLSPLVRSMLALSVFQAHANPDALLEDLPVDVLDYLPSHLQGLGAVLQYEILLATGRDQDARESADAVAIEFPEVEWRLERARRGNGLIPRIRKTMGIARQ